MVLQPIVISGKGLSDQTPLGGRIFPLQSAGLPPGQSLGQAMLRSARDPIPLVYDLLPLGTKTWPWANTVLGAHFGARCTTYFSWDWDVHGCSLGAICESRPEGPCIEL